MSIPPGTPGSGPAGARSIAAVLVANRGEIAVRVLGACRRLGLTGVAIFSDPDAGAMHTRVADRAVPIGGAEVAESYISIKRVLAAARVAGADAVHPGYGLLSENADFARAVLDAGLVWVGPPPEAIERMGDKLAARRTVLAAGVQPVPGSTEPVTSPEEIAAFGSAHGWPVAVKAAAGGGGRGIRVVGGPGEAAGALEAATREARNAFGDGTCYLERFFPRARHVEVQVLADQHGSIVQLGERDCSVQRRHQKLIEETPAPGLPPDVRERLLTSAVAVAASCGYVGVGTVENLWDPATGGTYFLEMNTRLQVEHPITELVTGTDLVALQLRVAAGAPLGFAQDDLRSSGHAIECRINAEDPANGFLPTPGRLSALSWPSGQGIRVDAGYEGGDEVPPYYDDLLGKVCAWGRDREEALSRMRSALAALRIEGVASTVPALRRILDADAFVTGRHWTTWLEEKVELSDLESTAPGAAEPDFTVTLDGAEHPVRLYRHRHRAAAGHGSADGKLTSPLAGTLLRLDVEPGAEVQAGQVVAVVEAMKMETPVRAPFAGTVVRTGSATGSSVAAGELLVELAPG